MSTEAGVWVAGSSHNGFRPPEGRGCLPGLGAAGIRTGSLPGLVPGCASGGVDEDGLGAAGSSGMFEGSCGDLPECFHISPEDQAQYPVQIQRAIHNVKFIHHHQMQLDKFDEVGIDGPQKLSLYTLRVLSFISFYSFKWRFIDIINHA